MEESSIGQGEDAHVAGVRIATGNAGIKQRVRDDVCILEIPPSASTAVVFTQNRFAAAPVQLARQHLALGINPRYLLINSGNANAGTGNDGIEDAAQLCAGLAEIAGVEPAAILPFSTGVIGQRLPVDKIHRAIPGIYKSLAVDAWQQAANAIMTTDTFPKIASTSYRVGDQQYRITGIAKGAGMIRPNMATMLSFIATDAAVLPKDLQEALSSATRKTFNRITIDGDTSTNDACVLVATGNPQSSSVIGQAHAHWREFYTALEQTCEALAKLIVKDGEGATKFVEVVVDSDNEQMSSEIAFTIAESPLVKTALFASDPNWGRILAAIGRAPVPTFDINTVSIYLDDYQIVKAGGVVANYDEATAAAVMAQPEFKIGVKIGNGQHRSRVWTCDLSYDYVKINAEYRT